MRKQISFIFITFVVINSFCQKPQTKNYTAFDVFLTEQNSKIKQIDSGMTISSVKETMGPSLIVAVPKKKKINALNQLFKQPEYTNHYTGNPKVTVDILWYFSTPKDQNGLISKSECTPILFENGISIGKGWDFFKQYRRTGNIR